MKKSVLFAATLLLLAFSLTFVSCEEKGSENNAFKGTWLTSQFIFENSFYPATLKFGASDWTLTVPSLNINEKGSYRLLTGNVAELSQNGSSIFSASISNSTLSVVSTGSPYGYGGQFTKQ